MTERGIIKIEQEVIEVLVASKVDGATLFLPETQLDRKLYEKVNKCLVALGGTWNRKARGHIFEDDPSDAIDEALLTGEVFNKKKAYQFFPTPLVLAASVCEWAEINSDCDVLEPSAGRGAIVEEIVKCRPRSVTVVELDEANAPFLSEKYDYCFIGQDFLTWESSMPYDRIVMNPPFSKKQDIQHILRAFELLKSGGILVSILSPSPFFCTDNLSVKFRDFLNGFNAEVIDFDPGAFKESGTLIRTKGIKVRKPL
jgi:predicted RNA methylase